MPLWLAGEPLVLASKSAIRHALLRDAGVPLEVYPADIDERTIEQRSPAHDAGELAALLAREKARTIAARLPGRLVLGADQTLALGERRFSKPGDRAGARAQLEALRGRTHELHTAIALVREGAILFEHREVARLTMRAFSDSFLEAYLDAFEQLDTDPLQLIAANARRDRSPHGIEIGFEKAIGKGAHGEPCHLAVLEHDRALSH